MHFLCVLDTASIQHNQIFEMTPIGSMIDVTTSVKIYMAWGEEEQGKRRHYLGLILINLI